jgi:hypothetical protein
MLKWILYILLGLVGLVGLVALIGLMLPKGHRASSAMVYRAAPAAVFAVVSDVERYPEWRSDVTKVELLPSDDQGPRFREHGKNGAVTYRIELSQPPSKLVVRIADTSLPFGGTWTYEFHPQDTKTELIISEEGEVYNPIFRFISRLFLSQTATIETYLADLKKRLGDS